MIFGLLVSILSLALTIAAIVFLALVIKSALRRTWSGEEVSAAGVGGDAARDTQSIYERLANREADAAEPGTEAAQPPVPHSSLPAAASSEK
jgi:hypothetical protein